MNRQKFAKKLHFYIATIKSGQSRPPLDAKLLTLRIYVLSFTCSISVGRTYGIGGQLPKCPFSYSESFNPLVALEELLILAERYSGVLISSFLKNNMRGT